MKNIARAREGDTREEKERQPERPTKLVSRPLSLPITKHQIALDARETQVICQSNALYQATIDVFFFAYSAYSKLYTDSLILSIAYLFVDKLNFESFVLEPQNSFLAHGYN